MAFNQKNCLIPTVYCGTSKKIPKDADNDSYYVKKGSPYECLMKGYGVGSVSKRNKKLPKNSLQQIKYVGETYENNFKNVNIKTINNLLTYARTHTKKEIDKLLSGVFKKKTGKSGNSTVDYRAYNSTLLYFYRHGMSENLPSCHKIKK